MKKKRKKKGKESRYNNMYRIWEIKRRDIACISQHDCKHGKRDFEFNDDEYVDVDLLCVVKGM